MFDFSGFLTGQGSGVAGDLLLIVLAGLTAIVLLIVSSMYLAFYGTHWSIVVLAPFACMTGLVHWSHQLVGFSIPGGDLLFVPLALLACVAANVIRDALERAASRRYRGSG